MRIVMNAQFWAQPTVGSGQYLHGLVHGLAALDPTNQLFLLVPAGTHLLLPAPASAQVIPLATPFDRVNANLAKLWFEQIAAPRAAAALRADVFHVPYFAPPLRSAVPLVTTVGDIIPLLLPEYRGGPHVRLYMALARRGIHTSQQVVTFSACSRADLLALERYPAERVTVTLLAAGAAFVPGDRQLVRQQLATIYGLDQPYLYYVGGLDARKNLPMLIEAYALYRRAGGEVPLVIAGKALGGDRRLFPDLDQVIAQFGLQAMVRRIQVPHEHGPLLYQGCEVFVFPSRYEGFGLPPLEAMACGAPVICSDQSSLPEVTGDAALLLPPDRPQRWAEALQQLLSDPSQREAMRQRGFAQAAQFSYRACAAQTLAVYQRV